MFTSLLSWIVDLVLFAPFLLLQIVGLLMPSCSGLGIPVIQADWLNSMIQLLRLFVPWFELFNVAGFFNLFSAVLLYFFFKFLWAHLPWLAHLAMRFWWVIAILGVIWASLNVFTDTDWCTNDFFIDTFGTSTCSGVGGGGSLGGGGGGSW